MSIKLAASSTLKTSGLSTLSVNQHANAGVTATSAPVLLTVQANETIDATTFANMVSVANPDLTSAFVARILNALNETVEGIVDQATYAPTIDLGWGKFVFEIAGSLATASGTPTEENYCYFSGQVDSQYQREFAQMDAYVATTLNPCDLKRIVDAGTGDLNAIYGNDTFYAEGRGLVTGSLLDVRELCQLDGTKVCDLAIDSDGSYDNSMKLSVPTTADVPVGTYVVKLKCVVDGTLYPMEKKVTVKVAAVIPPTITKVTQEGRADDTVLHDGDSPCVVHGTGLALGTADKVLIELYQDGVCVDEGDLTAARMVVSSSDTAINLSGFDWNNRTVPDGDWWDAYPDSKLIVVKNGVRYEHPITFKGE